MVRGKKVRWKDVPSRAEVTAFRVPRTKYKLGVVADEQKRWSKARHEVSCIMLRDLDFVLHMKGFQSPKQQAWKN